MKLEAPDAALIHDLDALQAEVKTRLNGHKHQCSEFMMFVNAYAESDAERHGQQPAFLLRERLHALLAKPQREFDAYAEDAIRVANSMLNRHHGSHQGAKDCLKIESR